MEVLLCVSERDTKCKLFNTSILDYMIKRLRENHNINIYTDSEKIRQQYVDKLVTGKNLTEVIEHFANKSDFIIVSRLAICNINFDNLIKYHANHGKDITVVTKNLVKNKSIPIYKLDDNKNITEVVTKRFADTGIYLIKKDTKIEGKTLVSLINQKMREKQVKAFIHKGYWYSMKNIRKRRSKDGSTLNF